MVISTVLDRFLQGRRLNDEELHELLDTTPEMHDRVVTALEDRYLTRRALRGMIERIPALRVDLGRRLLAREPRTLDLLELIQDVPELRELALQALRGDGVSPVQMTRVARRNPRLREAVVNAVLSQERTVERISELVERMPGSEVLVVDRLRALGVSPAELESIVTAVPQLRPATAPGATARSVAAEWRSKPDRRAAPVRDAQPTRTAPHRDAQPLRDAQPERRAQPQRDSQPDRPPRQSRRRGAAEDLTAEPIGDDEGFELVTEPMPSGEAVSTEVSLPPPPAARGSRAHDAGGGGRPDPWADTAAPPEDELDLRWNNRNG
ncbi:MAG: hypothetical protein O3A10_05990 [Chloroflexi bacterium]|nr:hypothetical protein [Chloroflexota bacterium]